MWRVRQYYDPLYCLSVMLLHFAAAWMLMLLVVWENSRRQTKTASLLNGVNGAEGPPWFSRCRFSKSRLLSRLSAAAH